MNRGYKIIKKRAKTLQGNIFEAELISESDKKNKTKICIKQTNKKLCKNHESIQDELTVIVDENIVKEALILEYLTVINQPKGGHIAKYIKFFQTENDFYLVMEYVGDNNLGFFVRKCHHYIKQNRLKLSHYKKIIKYIFWQMVTTINWMHDDMNCVHLDLCMDNIIVSDNAFIINKIDKKVTINPNIYIKFIDFGLGELYEANTKSFVCNKRSSYIMDESYEYSSPSLVNDVYYNSKKQDIWSLGIILYKMLSGNKHFDKDEYETEYENLDEFIKINNLQRYFNKKIVNLLDSMLNVDENKRFSAMDIIKCGWFESYYNKYRFELSTRSKQQKKINKKQLNTRNMQLFPYYSN